LDSSNKDGIFTKACIELNRGENIITEAKTAHEFNEKILKEDDTFSPSERVGIFGDQHAPFPFLAISGEGNKVVVLHGIRKFVVPFSYSHKNDGDTIAFCGDTTEKQLFPRIVKLDEYELEEAREWQHPEINAIMNITDSKTVLELLGEDPVVQVSKIIPLPTFLVPLFMNEGHPRSAVASFQSFVDDFFQAAPKQVKNYTQYIFDYLLAASGSEDDDEEKVKSSQLAINMADIEFNPVLMQWASTHFSSVEKIAAQHDKRIEKEKMRVANNTIPQLSRNLAFQTPANRTNHAGNGNQADVSHFPTNNTRTSIQEGRQNPVDVAHATQATNHATYTMGIQNPPGTMANQLQGSANNGTTMGTQNPFVTTQTGNNVPVPAPMQGWYNMGPPTQGWNMNQPAPSHPWTPGQGQAQYPPNPNYWYPYHPGPFPSQQATSSQATAQGQQVTEIPPVTNTARGQTVTRPPPTDDSSTKEMFVSAFRTMFAEEIGVASAAPSTLSSGKSAKILNGVNQYSVRAYAGRKITEEVPEIFRILDSNKNITTKVQALEDRLSEAQETNAMVKFTLRRDLVKQFMQHQFFSDPIEDNMLHGFTPFCIQCMDKKSKYNLISWEKRIDSASHTVEADFDKKEAALKVMPITDALGFIAAISNTRALAWALFTSSSPLTQDLNDLYEIIIDGYQTGELEAANDMQPDWYAHALWSLYKDISKFFKKRFTEEDLRQGYHMRSPLTDYNREIKRFTSMYTSGVPPCLLVQTRQLAMEETAPGGERTPKRPAGTGGKIPKKQKVQDGKAQWKDNKKFDATLKSVKQNIVQAHDKINLGMLMHANGTTTGKVLASLGIPTTACGRFLLWGACGDKECALSHEELKLTTAQVAQVKDMLTDASKKITDKSERS